MSGLPTFSHEILKTQEPYKQQKCRRIPGNLIKRKVVKSSGKSFSFSFLFTFQTFLNQNRSSKESKVCSSFSFVLFLPLVPSLYKCQILHQETVKIPEHLSSNLYSHKFLWNFRFSIHYLHCVSYTRKQK
uniref:Uncharacterized protein n=1 Tax=Cacopsylla melanoneura TaxID=428564 RepID=A0A8D8QST4_9HEMI